MIPNTDKESFSFIYKDHEKVDEVIKVFIISQDPSNAQTLASGGI